MIIAIDPGKKCAGVAVFSGKDMIDVALIRGDSAFDVARCVQAYVRDKHNGMCDELIIEGQQIYGRGVSKGDPNDLLPLAQVVGAVNVLIPHSVFRNPKPREWKGTVKKEIMLHRIESRLTANEKIRLLGVKPASLRHNAVDAIGIGLWAVGRL